MVRKPLNLAGDGKDCYDPITEEGIIQTLQLMKNIPHPESVPVENKMTVVGIKGGAKKAEEIFKAKYDLTRYGNRTKHLSNAQLFWIFDLYELGINKIDSGHYKKENIDYTKQELDEHKSHSFAHMAWIANRLAERRSSDLEKKIAIHKVAYKCYNESLKVPTIHRDVNPFYFAISRARTARMIAEESSMTSIKKAYSWNKLCYRDIIRSLKIYDESDVEDRSKHAYLHGSLGSVAEFIAAYTESGINVDYVSWLEKASEHNFKSAELSEDINYTHSALSTAHSARNAYTLFLLTGEELHKKNALARYTRFIRMYEGAQESLERVHKPSIIHGDETNVLEITQPKYDGLYIKCLNLVKELISNQNIGNKDISFNRKIRI